MKIKTMMMMREGVISKAWDTNQGERDIIRNDNIAVDQTLN